MAQTFFALDADTCQPVAFLTGTSARTVAPGHPRIVANGGRNPRAERFAQQRAERAANLGPGRRRALQRRTPRTRSSGHAFRPARPHAPDGLPQTPVASRPRRAVHAALGRLRDCPIAVSLHARPTRPSSSIRPTSGRTPRRVSIQRLSLDARRRPRPCSDRGISQTLAHRRVLQHRPRPRLEPGRHGSICTSAWAT